MYSYFEIPFNTMRVLDMSWVVIGGRCVWGGGGGARYDLYCQSHHSPGYHSRVRGQKEEKWQNN